MGSLCARNRLPSQGPGQPPDQSLPSALAHRPRAFLCSPARRRVSNDLRRRSSACRLTCTRKRPRTPAPGAHRACQIRTRRSNGKRSCGFLLGSFKSGAGSIAPAEAAALFPRSPALRALFWRSCEIEALSRRRSVRGSGLQPLSRAARAGAITQVPTRAFTFFARDPGCSA